MHLPSAFCVTSLARQALQRCTGLVQQQRLCFLPCRSLGANFGLEYEWDHLAPLKYLTSLDLSLISFHRLPPVLSQLTSLRRLLLYSCTRLTASDEAWRALEGHPSLQTLRAPFCNGLAAVPAALSTLHSLEALDLWSNPQMAEGGGWHHLAALPSLTHLGLSHCGLRGVPPELAALAEHGILSL